VSFRVLENIALLVCSLFSQPACLFSPIDGVNGLEFGWDGELYIQIGGKLLIDCSLANVCSSCAQAHSLFLLLFKIPGNTNAGVPGPISSREDLDEGYFSAATLVAYLARENFDGFITYDDATGLPITGLDVEVFASGQRNPFDIVMHSNGNIYATGK